MAIMDAAGRKAAFLDFLAEIRKRDDVFNVSKADVQAAVDAIDQWVSDNAASYNLAIPQPARNTLTSAQKAAILMLVLQRRYLVGV